MAERAVWAPDATTVDLCLADGLRHPMRRTERGWWHTEVTLPPGARYAYSVEGAEPCPDPRSSRQPDGVHAASAVYDHGAFGWTDQNWAGSRLPGGVLYELHIGTFTEAGTFDAAVAHLDHLVALGVTMVEVMPVAAYDGNHGWGYDGVVLGAVHEPYGGPDGLKRFVDACHANGLGVCLDVVYNHLGPSGNYLADFGPYFTTRYATPWGPAVNLDDRGSDEVRRFLLDNALGWFRDFHVDALRLDAVHALHDDRAVHLLEELSAETDALSAALGRPLWLIAESDRNDPRTVRPRASGGLGVHAQWDDDVHHALHALLTGERAGYYADFGSYEVLAKTLSQAFLHDGVWSSFRGRTHGRPIDPHTAPGWRFVVALNTHDQIGNRAAGDRPSATLEPGLLAIGAGLLLTSAYTPMLFMGEEWAASTPWQFFSDFGEPHLAEAVRTGRRSEFADYGWDPELVPDPQDPATFHRSTLDWDEPSRPGHERMLRWYAELLRLRRTHADLSDPRLDRVMVTADADAGWLLVHRGALRVLANLSDGDREIPLDGPVGSVLIAWEPLRVSASAETVVVPPRTLGIVTLGGDILEP